MRVVERVAHEIGIHSQKEYRWSYRNPPLATLPPDLRCIYVPDPGWPWCGWDHEGIELRILACEARSRYLLDALLGNKDLHTMTACEVFGLPYPPVFIDPIHAAENAARRERVQWLACNHSQEVCGKDDPRRGFAKQFRYRRNYRGDPKEAMDIPGAKVLGLTKQKLMQAAARMDAADPDVTRWWRQVDADVLKLGYSRDWRGGIRRFLDLQPWTKPSAIKRMQREATNNPMQMGTQSIENVIFIEVAQTYGEDVLYKYGSHDSQWWAIRESEWDRIVPGIKEIASRPREINGVSIPLPCSWKERRAT